MKKDKNESFAHYFAKKLLVKWLRDSDESFCGIEWRSNRSEPFYGVFEEYPLTQNFHNVWDEQAGDWIGEYPNYDWMKTNHVGKFKIADIAIQHKGMISDIIEVVHKNDLSEEKVHFYKSFPFSKPNIYVIPTHWILSQIDVPTKIPKEFKVL